MAFVAGACFGAQRSCLCGTVRATGLVWLSWPKKNVGERPVQWQTPPEFGVGPNSKDHKGEQQA